jgi:sodium/potassium/calcium exchanger 6
MLGVSVVGLLGSILIMIYASDGTSETGRMIRCFGGFICSMVWIAAIANEVVDVLRAVGEILGLSDAIIGLTSESTTDIANQSSL